MRSLQCLRPCCAVKLAVSNVATEHGSTLLVVVLQTRRSLMGKGRRMRAAVAGRQTMAKPTARETRRKPFRWRNGQRRSCGWVGWAGGQRCCLGVPGS